MALHWYLWLAAALFAIGSVGVMVRRNALIVMMCLELMMNAANLTFLAFARQQGAQGQGGHAIAFFVIAVAACEAAVGLAIVIAVFRTRGNLELEQARVLHE